MRLEGITCQETGSDNVQLWALYESFNQENVKLQLCGNYTLQQMWLLDLSVLLGP
jgi:hypothetical protein